MRYILLIAVLMAIISVTYCQRYPRHCDPDLQSFKDRHVFQLGRMTVDPENTFWIQNVTIMQIDDIRDDTYHDIIKITYGQKAWYDAENCRFVFDQAWPYGPGLWRMSRVYSYIEDMGSINGQGNSKSLHPSYRVQFSAEHLLWEHRAVTYLDYRSQTLTNNYQLGYAVVPGLEHGVFNEIIETIRPHEHAYYSNNDPPRSPTSLPNWTWFHSHASTDPASDFNQELKPCFDALNSGTLPRINDPLAALEGQQWEISACFTNQNQARNLSPRNPTETTRVVDGINIITRDGFYLSDTALGVLTRDRLTELQASNV